MSTGSSRGLPTGVRPVQLPKLDRRRFESGRPLQKVQGLTGHLCRAPSHQMVTTKPDLANKVMLIALDARDFITLERDEGDLLDRLDNFGLHNWSEWATWEYH